MKISTRLLYIFYILILHIVLILLVYKTLSGNKLIFIVSELFLLISLLVSVIIYRRMVRPVAFFKAGMETIRDKDFTVKLVSSGNDETDAFVQVYNLMIDELRKERTQLLEQHFFLGKLIEASPVAIIVLDFDEKIVSVNQKFKTLFSLTSDDVAGQPLDFLDQDIIAHLAALPVGGSETVKINNIETFRIHKSHFMDRGFRRLFITIEELTAEMLESEKNAFGIIIRMMAHEVNNTLGATNSILETSIQYLPEVYADLSGALTIALERNNQLKMFMRNFADVVRLPLPVKQPVAVDSLIKRTTQFMTPLAEQEGLNLVVDILAHPVILLDAAQIEQVLINVIKNAIEACESGNEIRIELRSNNLAIRNNGKPITHEISSRLFTPFYSTKSTGQGIGLTLTKEILRNHGFAFSLKTSEDGWTAFEIGF